ncbi:MAG: hypothetical protein IJV27_12590 [Prevotella sp.]|nr:hypothetical protein [Prevotella sp.]
MKKLWGKMKTPQRQQLIGKIIVDGYGASTAYAFCNGTRVPKEHYKDTISGYILEITGRNIPGQKLFPAS